MELSFLRNGMSVAPTNLPSNREEPAGNLSGRGGGRPERCGQLFPERDVVTPGFPRDRVWHASECIRDWWQVTKCGTVI